MLLQRYTGGYAAIAENGAPIADAKPRHSPFRLPQAGRAFPYGLLTPTAGRVGVGTGVGEGVRVKVGSKVQVGAGDALGVFVASNSGALVPSGSGVFSTSA